MSKTVQLAIEPVASRMEDKQTRFQLAPAAHMMTARIDLPQEQADLILGAHNVKLAYEKVCRAITVGEPIDGLLTELSAAMGKIEVKRGPAPRKSSTRLKLKTSAKDASAATSKQAATSEQTSSSDDAEAQSDPSEG